MYVTLTCNMCHNHFQVAFDEKEFNIKKCPVCNSPISHADNERVYSITEQIYVKNNRLESIAIDSMYFGRFADMQSTEAYDNIFYHDLRKLEEIFKQATPEMQSQLSSIVDTLYLLIYHDAKDGALNKIDETYQKIRTLFLGKVNSKNVTVL